MIDTAFVLSISCCHRQVKSALRYILTKIETWQHQVCTSGLDWIRFDWIWFDWICLVWNGLDKVKLNWISYTSSEWVDRIGLDWTRLDCLKLKPIGLVDRLFNSFAETVFFLFLNSFFLWFLKLSKRNSLF